MDPVGLTRFTTPKNSRLLLLLRKVMAVPLCPNLPALPTWMKERQFEKKKLFLTAFMFKRLHVSVICIRNIRQKYVLQYSIRYH